MGTKIFLYLLVILNDNGLKYENKHFLENFQKVKNILKNGQKKVQNQKIFFKYKIPKKNHFLRKIYFCYVIA